MRRYGLEHGRGGHRVGSHLSGIIMLVSTCLLILLTFHPNSGVSQTLFPLAGRQVQSGREAGETRSFSSCQEGWAWPVDPGDGSGKSIPMRGFDNPPQDWLPGHRGIDLQVGQEVSIRAPEGGYIAFAGKVGGKSVISLRHDRKSGILTSTFEPATTVLPLGARVKRGEIMGLVQGHSDHCDGICIHWGLRKGERKYLDPMSKVFGYRLVLKPVEGR